jgi:hypothetical protein
MTRAQRIQAIDHAIAKEERLKLRALRAKNFAVARNHEKKIHQLQLQRAHLVHPGQGPGRSRASGQGPGKSRHAPRHHAAHPGDPKANIPITVVRALNRIVTSNVTGMNAGPEKKGFPPTIRGQSTAEVQYWPKNPIAQPVRPPTKTSTGRIERFTPCASKIPWTGNGVNVSKR